MSRKAIPTALSQTLSTTKCKQFIQQFNISYLCIINFGECNNKLGGDIIRYKTGNQTTNENILSANETMEIIEDAIKTENEFMKFVNELSIPTDEGDHRPSTVRNLFIIHWA